MKADLSQQLVVSASGCRCWAEHGDGKQSGPLLSHWNTAHSCKATTGFTNAS